MLLNFSAALGVWILLSVPTGLIVGRILRGHAVARETR
jgi:hypothetical protein